MTIDDFDAFLRRPDDLIEGRIRDELYDEGDGEAWDDLVAGVEWVAASKAKSRGGGAPVPATIHAHDFDFAQGSVLDFLVVHPDVPSVQISIDDLHRDLRDEAAVVGYIDSVRADARTRG